MQEIQDTKVPSLSQEDPQKEKIATHPSILVWEISWTEEPSRLHNPGIAESDMTKQLSRQHTTTLEPCLHSPDCHLVITPAESQEIC